MIGQTTPEQQADELLRAIQTRLSEPNGVVIVATHTKATEYQHRHRDMFRLNGREVQVQRGRSWVTVRTFFGDTSGGCTIRFARYQ